MKRFYSNYHFSAIQRQLFESGKIDRSRRKTAQGLIARLRFARDMRSLEQWCEYQSIVETWCDLLEDFCIIDNVERHILYDFIMENGKRDR